MKIRIATSQFAVSADISANRAAMLQQMQQAKAAGCDLIHFPEGSLSGYAGVDFSSFSGFDWPLLRSATEAILQQAKALQLWVLLGSAHPLSAGNKPHNSLYIINSSGQLADRYDKLFCAGDNTGNSGDLAHYTPGNHFSIFEINGVRCSTLICHDYRYPELYRELKKQGVQVVFHSYHAGNMDEERQAFMEAQIGEQYFPLNPGKTYPEITMPATMISYAANNYLWISCSNTAARESCWAGFMVRPDGVIIGKLEKNQPGILVNEIDTQQPYYDSTSYWRARAMEGKYHSGEAVTDARSTDRQQL